MEKDVKLKDAVTKQVIIPLNTSASAEYSA